MAGKELLHVTALLPSLFKFFHSKEQFFSFKHNYWEKKGWIT